MEKISKGGSRSEVDLDNNRCDIVTKRICRVISYGKDSNVVLSDGTSLRLDEGRRMHSIRLDSSLLNANVVGFERYEKPHESVLSVDGSLALIRYLLSPGSNRC